MKINKERMIGIRFEEAVIRKLDERVKNLRDEMGLKVSRQQLIAAAVRNTYLGAAL